MTPVEIAYFKHFMMDKGISASFQHYYRKCRIKTNPDSIEDYLLSTTKEDVIMKAFLFIIENKARYASATYEYWNNIDKQWQSYIQSMADNFTNDSWPMLKHTFAILRQNWNLPFYFRRENFESTAEVYERMHIDLPLPEFQWEHGLISQRREDQEQIKTNVFNAKDGDVLVRLHKCEDGHTSKQIILFRELEPYEDNGLKLYKAKAYAYYNCLRGKLKIGGETRQILVNPESKDVVFRLAFPEEKKILLDKLAEQNIGWNEEKKILFSTIFSDTEEPNEPVKEEKAPVIEDPLTGIDFFESNERSSGRLKRGDVSLNLRKGFVLTFNLYDSEDIQQANLPFVRHGVRDGSFLLVFNAHEGQKAYFSNRRDRRQVIIHSKDINTKLHTFLNVKSDYTVLHIEKVAATSDYIIYKITKQ